MNQLGQINVIQRVWKRYTRTPMKEKRKNTRPPVTKDNTTAIELATHGQQI